MTWPTLSAMAPTTAAVPSPGAIACCWPWDDVRHGAGQSYAGGQVGAMQVAAGRRHRWDEAGGRAGRRRRAAARCGRSVPTPTGTATPRCWFAAAGRGRRRGARRATRWRAGSGCGGPMTAGGRGGVAAQHPAGAATSRCAAGWPSAPGCRRSSTTTPRRWPWARAGSARPAGERDFIAMVVSTGVGGGIVLDGRLLDGAAGNAGHIGHVIVEPDGRPLRVRGAGLPRGRGVGHGDPGRHRRARRPRPRPERAAADRHARRPGGGVGGQPARPAPGRGRRLGGARLRRRLLRRRPGRARRPGPPRRSPPAPASCPPAWATTGRWSARPPWPARALGRLSGHRADGGGCRRLVPRGGLASDRRRWRRRRGRRRRAHRRWCSSERGPRSSRRPQSWQSHRNYRHVPQEEQ